jgi:hypothetical protein
MITQYSQMIKNNIFLSTPAQVGTLYDYKIRFFLHYQFIMRHCANLLPFLVQIGNLPVVQICLRPIWYVQWYSISILLRKSWTMAIVFLFAGSCIIVHAFHECDSPWPDEVANMFISRDGQMSCDPWLFMELLRSMTLLTLFHLKFWTFMLFLGLRVACPNLRSVIISDHQPSDTGVVLLVCFPVEFVLEKYKLDIKIAFWYHCCYVGQDLQYARETEEGQSAGARWVES